MSELQTRYYIHFLNNILKKGMNHPSPGNRLNSTATVILQGWCWHYITNQGWYATKKNQRYDREYTLINISNCYILTKLHRSILLKKQRLGKIFNTKIKENTIFGIEPWTETRIRINDDIFNKIFIIANTFFRIRFDRILIKKKFCWRIKMKYWLFLVTYKCQILLLYRIFFRQ